MSLSLLVLLYSSPFLLNGTLWLIGYLKKRSCGYALLEQGLRFTLGLLRLSILLNGAMSTWTFVHQYYVLATVYGTAAVVVIALLVLLGSSR